MCVVVPTEVVPVATLEVCVATLCATPNFSIICTLKYTKITSILNSSIAELLSNDVSPLYPHHLHHFIIQSGCTRSLCLDTQWQPDIKKLVLNY